MAEAKVYGNLYYFDPKAVDLAKLRKDAQTMITGDYRTKPRDVVTIHYHKSTDSCHGKQHEDFRREE